jgi:hypothetical protein
VVDTSLIQAYNTHPYSSTLRTNAFISISFTLTLVIPIILQLVHTDIKLRLAAFNLAFTILSGLVASFYSIIPKYLNSCTVSIALVSINISSLQFTNMALVFPIFILNEFYLQKLCIRLSRPYSS